jgi:hypothetical protein
MSTEIVPRNGQAVAVAPDQAVPSFDLVAWAQQAEAAAIYAQRVCATQMVPDAYRGKPAEATAAILKGYELGFSPMASLAAFHNIKGTVVPAALTMRAVVQSAGHEIRVVESTDDRAEVHGRRRGGDWEVSVWDIPRARKLKQYETNPNYKTNPGQMLVARATAEVCRWIASDAIMGIPYAAEEMDDQRVIEAPAVRRLTVADLDTPAIEGPAATAAHPDQVTRDQQRHLFALWRELGFDGNENRHARLAGTAEILGLSDLESFNDLTFAQAEQAIAELRARRDAAVSEVPGGEG